MKVLTIVIPSYNTEPFIEKNIKTFLDERLYEKVEILIVNDGSKDRTAEIAGRYEKEYSGYIRKIDKENGGHGSVINRGIKEAEGKFFKVVDGDDWVNTENLVRLVMDLEKTNADAVINPVVTINQKTQKERLSAYDEIQALLPESPFDMLIKQNIRLSLHAVTYKTSVLRDNHITVTEKCFYEDWQYDLYPVPYLNTVTVLEYPVYWYLVGQKTQSVDAENALKNVEMSFKVFCDMVDFYTKHRSEFDMDLDRYMQNSIGIFLRSIYNIYIRNYRKADVYDLLKNMDQRIKSASQFFYDYVGDRYQYIRAIRNSGKVSFLFFGIMMKAYKSFVNR